MEYRQLGKTALSVSAVGFGTCQLRLLPERQAIDTLLTAFDLGVNLVHTGPDYGPAEGWVAAAVRLAGRPVIVAAHGSDAPSDGRGRVRQFESQFEATCRRHRTDRLDLFGIACIDDREAFGENVWGRNGMVEFLQRKKQEGRLTAAFCTTHGAPEYVAHLVRSGVFDAVMLAYNPLGYHLLSLYPTPGRHFESIPRNQAEVFPLCRQHGVGVMVMKPLAGGLLCQPRAFPTRHPRADERPGESLRPRPRAADVLRAILRDPSVTCVVPGTNSVTEAEENARAGTGPFDLDEGAVRAIDGTVDDLRRTVCSRCGDCEPLCSRRLPVSWLFRAALINLHPSATHEVLDHVDYFRLAPSGDAPCAGCENQSCLCSAGLDIPRALTALHRHMVNLADAGVVPGPRPGEPAVVVPRAASRSAAVGIGGMTGSAGSTIQLEALPVDAEARDTAIRRRLHATTERLRRLEHAVEALRSSRGYRLMRRAGRWEAFEAALASAPSANQTGHDVGSSPWLPDTIATDVPAVPIEPVHDWSLNPVIHPLEGVRGYRGHLVDDTGRDFVDLSSAWGANLLGYGYPAVAHAIAAQAGRYAGIGMPCPEFRELVQVLQGLIPGAEHVRFGKNGSDATMGAVRLARAVTGRERVLHRGYHGFHDWWMASTDCAGVPVGLRDLILPLENLSPAAVHRAFRQHPDSIACLIVDPMVPPTAAADDVREIIDVVHRHGALVILDEVVSGFRVAPGGMQHVWNIRPDLSCFGKGVANGMPLSVLAGRDEYMRRLPATRYGMTFEGEAVSLAAALATIQEIRERQVCVALADKGRALAREYSRIAGQYGVRTQLAGPPARPHVAFVSDGGLDARVLRWLFIQELSRANVLTIGVFNLCFSHDAADLATVASACEAALRTVRRALDERSVEGLLDPRIREGLRLAGSPA